MSPLHRRILTALDGAPCTFEDLRARMQLPHRAHVLGYLRRALNWAAREELVLFRPGDDKWTLTSAGVMLLAEQPRV